jgi:hypothetical protein
LIKRIYRSLYFAIQFDESTDVTNFAQLMVYIRYEWNNEMHEDFLFVSLFLNTLRQVRYLKSWSNLWLKIELIRISV